MQCFCQGPQRLDRARRPRHGCADRSVGGQDGATSVTSPLMAYARHLVRPSSLADRCGSEPNVATDPRPPGLRAMTASFPSAPESPKPEHIKRICYHVANAQGNLNEFDIAVVSERGTELGPLRDAVATWAMHAFWPGHRPDQILRFIAHGIVYRARQRRSGKD
jgi:hypothetical protein